MQENTGQPAVVPTRRTVIRGAAATGVAVPFLAACSADEEAARGGSGSGSLASTSEVPVGEGTVLKDEQIVLTQPTAGEFKAFSALCTHQGCTFTSVSKGRINCACHGSQFSIGDGSNVRGPSGQPAGSVADLEGIPVKVQGDQIVKG